jgi:hypothetical protein
MTGGTGRMLTERILELLRQHTGRLALALKLHLAGICGNA